jgi:ankyrin repeat protein
MPLPHPCLPDVIGLVALVAPTEASAAGYLNRLTSMDDMLHRAIVNVPHGRTGRTRLMAAARAGSLARVHQLIALGADVEARTTVPTYWLDIAFRENVPSLTQSSALSFALCHGYVEVASALIAAGAHVQSALQFAAKQVVPSRLDAARIAVRKVLAEHAAAVSPNVAFFAGAHFGLPDVVQALLFTVYPTLRTPTIWDHVDAYEWDFACFAEEWKRLGLHGGSFSDTLRVLADPLVRYGKPPLRIAGDALELSFIYELLEDDDSFEEQDWSELLAVGAELGVMELVRLAISRGADPCYDPYASQGQMTPLASAASKGHVDVVRFMISVPGVCRVQAAAAAARCNRLDELEALMKSDSSIGPDATVSVWTLLDSAAIKGHCDVLSCLLRAGASADSIDSALMYAARSGHVDVMRMLLAAGAQVNRCHPQIGTALMVAAAAGSAAAVEVLLAAGALPNAQLPHEDDGAWAGATALWLACVESRAAAVSRLNVAVALLAAGADAHLRPVGRPYHVLYAADPQVSRGLAALGVAPRPTKLELSHWLARHLAAEA